MTSLSLVLTLLLMAMNDFAATEFKIDGIPGKLSWNNRPLEWEHGRAGLRIKAGPKTDLFLDPQGEYSVVSSPRAMFLPDRDFILSCKVKVGFQSDYDAGVLVLFASGTSWAKLCFEYSPQKKPTIVSVVNNGVSDDANHASLGGNEVYLRVSSLGQNAFAFHFSVDGDYWNLVRYFRLESKDPVKVGFSSQSPTGQSCESNFSGFHYSNRKLENIRNGQ